MAIMSYKENTMKGTLIVLLFVACIPWLSGCSINDEIIACYQLADMYCESEHMELGRMADMLENE